MRAGAEGQAGIQPDDHGSGISRWRLVTGNDPQPPAEAHGMEVLQPFALPHPIGQAFGADGVRGNAERLGQHDDGGGVRSLGVEHRLQHGLRPEPQFTGRRLEDGVIHRVGQRHGQRASGEAGVLGRGCELSTLPIPPRSTLSVR